MSEQSDSEQKAGMKVSEGQPRVTIQAIRLEYYEFFSKFFGGTGEKFEPFFISR